MCIERKGEIMCRERKGRGYVVRSVGEMNVCRERGRGRGFVVRSVGEMNVCRERGRGEDLL